MELRVFRWGQNLPTDPFGEDIQRGLEDYFEKFRLIINGGINIEDNCDVGVVSATMDATPGVATTVAHGLGRTPSGYILAGSDRACRIYNSTASDSTNLYLKCDVASAAITVLVF